MNLSRFSLDHFQGCLLGGAIGDALGAPLEFLTIDQIRQQYGPNGITEYVEPPDGRGNITDDTQMTLFTAEGLLSAHRRAMSRGIRGAHIHITHHSYLRWLITQGQRSSSPDIGGLKDSWLLQDRRLHSVRAPGLTCLSALCSDRFGTIDTPLNNSKGAGGVMRVASVGLLFYKEPSYAFEVGCDLAAITHGHPSGYLAAGTFAAIISFLIHGETLEKSINESVKILQSFKGHEETFNKKYLTTLPDAVTVSKQTEGL